MRNSIKYLTFFFLFFACLIIIAQNANKTIPGFYIDGLKGGVISKADFIKADSIKCTDKNVVITSFSMSFSHQGAIQEFRNFNAAITRKMKTAISKESFKGEVWIDNIKACYSNGEALKEQSISFKVK